MSIEVVRARRVRGCACAWLAALVLSFCLSTPASLAQDEGARRELEVGKQQVEQLRRDAEVLAGAGKHDKAADLREKAARLMRRIEEGARKLEQRERQLHQRERLHKVLDGLERGMEALRAIKKHDALEMLERIAANVRREIKQDERGRERNKAQQREKRHVELVRIAVRALAKAGKNKAAELLEHTLHAHELRLEGRKDPEARKIMESAPSWEHNVELLRYAAEFLKKQGQIERSAALNKLAGHILQSHRKERPKGHDGASDVRRRGGREEEPDAERRESRARFERVMHRVEVLEQKVNRLANAMERLMKELRTQRERR